MKKTLWDILKETFTGNTQEGSAKRITAFFFVVVLLGSLTYVYEMAFWVSANSATPTSVQIQIVKMYEPLHFSLQLSIWIILGLATVEGITWLVKTLKGNVSQEPTDSKKEE